LLVVPDLSDLRLPVLVVNGEHDTVERRRAGVDLARIVRHARRVVVPAAGHLANLDNPRAYNEALREFLDQHCHEPLSQFSD
jgi:3-oxoadipate enol-lactonase